MLEIDKSYEINTYPLRLYKSDIVELFNLLDKYFDFEIEMGNYKLQTKDEINEVSEKLSKIKKIKINCGKKSEDKNKRYYDLNIKFDVYSSIIRIYNKDDIEMMGILNKIIIFLTSHRKFGFIKGLFYIITKIVIILIPFYVFLLISLQYVYGIEVISKTIISSILALIISIFIFNTTNVLDYNTIFLFDRVKLSFWKRNKDKIIVGIIVALLSAFLTLCITYYFTVLRKPLL